ncbi:hypothetical protein DCC79_00305 [bacterium]|nr:TIGR02594 family protein [Chloroflexi bacterium CFX6]RIL12705.1 MAG: hypothetical protein DCC79_00305 [bacterium]
MARLQRALGNQAMGRVVQAKLKVGPPGDRHEQEADRMAASVMTGSAPVQRQAMADPESQSVQAKESPGGATRVSPRFERHLGSLRGGGKPLPGPTRAFFEPRFGQRFGDVRVHTDGSAAELARSVNARAFTVGRDIVFGAGEYAPRTDGGKRLLAHELTHVVQQGDGRLRRMPAVPSEAAPARPTLRRGDRGMWVKELQVMLNTADLVPLKSLVPDGDFGAATELHVAEFQRRRGLQDDGIVGANTWHALDHPAAPADLGPIVDWHRPTAPEAAGGTSEPPWISVARAEIGMKEIKGEKHNPRIVEYLKTTGSWWSADETPWCSGFVNWVMAKAGYAGTGSAKAVSWLDWGTTVDQPALGAIGVISYGGGKGHVGFVVGKQGGNVLLLGGNQSDEVKISTFAADRFSVFAFPNGYVVPTSAFSLRDSKKDFGKPVGFEGTR